MTPRIFCLALLLPACASQDALDAISTPARLERAAVQTHLGTFDACARIVDAPELASLERPVRVAVATRCSADVRAAWEVTLQEFERAAELVCRAFQQAEGCAK